MPLCRTCQGPPRPKGQRLWIQGPTPCSPISQTNSDSPSPHPLLVHESAKFSVCCSSCSSQTPVYEGKGRARCPLRCFLLLQSALLTLSALRAWESCPGIPYKVQPRVSPKSPYDPVLCTPWGWGRRSLLRIVKGRGDYRSVVHLTVQTMRTNSIACRQCHKHPWPVGC